MKRKTNWLVIFVVLIMGLFFLVAGVQGNIIALVILGAFELLIALVGIIMGVKELKIGSVPKEKACPNCGTPYDDETHVCKNCGLQL